MELSDADLEFVAAGKLPYAVAYAWPGGPRPPALFRRVPLVAK